MHKLSIALFLSLAATGACSHDEVGNSDETLKVASPVEATTAPKPAAAPLTSSELADLVRNVEARPTRGDSLVIADERLRVAEAAPLLIERIRAAGDDQRVRVALVRALPGTRSEYAAGLVDAIAIERDVTVRATMAEVLSKALDRDVAVAGMQGALRDSDAEVRKAAAMALGWKPDGVGAKDALIAALADSETSVQAQAARALGVLEVAEAFDTMQPLLSSRSADVRLEALRGMARIDADKAAALPELATLENDDDQRILSAVATVKAKGY